MKRISTPVMIGLSSLFSCLVLSGSALAAHNSCSDCHIRGNSLKNPSVNELCITCHPENVKDHVLDVVSQVKPEGLPLDSQSRITCITCHDAHDRSGHPSMLRLEQGKICAPCHPRS